MNQIPLPAPDARTGLREAIRRIPLENISSLARDGFGDPSIIPLWFGEGDRPAPAFIGEAMARAVAAGHVFYTHQNGIPELRAALSDYQTGLGVRAIGPQRITVTTSFGTIAIIWINHHGTFANAKQVDHGMLWLNLLLLLAVCFVPSRRRLWRNMTPCRLPPCFTAQRLRPWACATRRYGFTQPNTNSDSIPRLRCP